MDETLSIQGQLDSLRQKCRATATVEEMGLLLDESRVLLKTAFQTSEEEAARALFRELRERTENVASAARLEAEIVTLGKREQLLRRIQREQMRLTSGSLHDMELAVSDLYEVLRELGSGEDEAFLRQEILHILEGVAKTHAELQRKIKELLESSELASVTEVRALLDRLNQVTVAAVENVPMKATAPLQEPDLLDRFQQHANARRLFYAGDYYQAADILAEIIRRDPNDQQAKDRLAQIEDNIRRGVVPDSRVPFEARVAFGRAQSLERAGRFEEAREAYRSALLEARAGGLLLENWQPAIEALLRINNSVIAREMREEGDAFLAATIGTRR